MRKLLVLLFRKAATMLKFSCRDYLIQGRTEDKGYGLYSYILLTSRYGNGDQLELKRYIKLYDAYLTLNELELYKEQGIDKNNLNITYWLVKSLPDKNSSYNGKYFVDNYDYVRADILLRRTFTNINNPGPFIISYHFPFNVYKSRRL